jgi:hypothetical protein
MLKNKDYIFVCSAINNNSLISKEFLAQNEEAVKNSFHLEFGFYPEKIFGPFSRKYSKQTEQKKEVVFSLSGSCKKAIYKDWHVNAFTLKEPENHAYIIFLKRIDESKPFKNKGSLVVPLSELRIL